MNKKALVSITDLLVLSSTILFFISLLYSGQLLILMVMGVVISLALKSYLKSRILYLDDIFQT